MKKILFAFLLVLGTTAAFAQAQKGAETKTKTKTTTAQPKTAKSTDKKTTAKPGSETAEQKAAREKMAIEKGRALTENMDKNLHFTPKQYEEVLKINQRSISQVEYAKVRYIKNLRKMNNEIQNIGASRMSLLKDVLTQQQFEKYNQKRAEKMGLPGENSPQPAQQPGRDNYDN